MVSFTFTFQLNDFMANFRATGPGAPVEMGHGLKLIEPYSEKLNYFEAQRLDLSEFNDHFIPLWVCQRRPQRFTVDQLPSQHCTGCGGYPFLILNNLYDDSPSQYLYYKYFCNPF